MSDHVTGNLTDEHQKLKGHLVNTDDTHISGSLSPKSRTLKGNLNSNGTKDYNHLLNKPSVNEVELVGDKSFEDLGLAPLSNADLAELLK